MSTRKGLIDPFTVDCPKCSAKAFHRCRLPWGAEHKAWNWWHPAREVTARRQATPRGPIVADLCPDGDLGYHLIGCEHRPES